MERHRHELYLRVCGMVLLGLLALWLWTIRGYLPGHSGKVAELVTVP